MLDPRWMKILRDLWFNKTRTVLVVASIAVGIFAVGTVQHLSTVLLDELDAVFVASNPSHAFISADNLDEGMLDTIRRMPEVAEVAGRSSLGLKVEIEPGKWEAFTLTAIEDFEDIQMDKILPLTELNKHPEFGVERTRWPEENEIILENSSLDARDVLPRAWQTVTRYV